MLIRDGRQCQGCAELDERLVLVHHRQRGVNRPRRLITLCRRCHPKVHRALQPRVGWPAILRELWREVHPGLAEQLEFSFYGAIVRREDADGQPGLFDAA